MINAKDSKIWFITGCASGLGLALAEKAIELGHKVAGTSRTIQKFEKTSLFGHPNFLPVETDLLSEGTVKESVEKCVERFGRIDVVVNNSGYSVLGACEEVKDNELRDNFDINFFAPMNVIRSTLPILRSQRSGTIINVASILGFTRFEGGSSYSATKWSLVGMTEALAEEVRPLGIKAIVLCPGSFKTPLIERTNFSQPIGDYNQQQLLDTYYQRRGNKPFGDPSKYAEFVFKYIELENPPVHLFIGADAVEMVEKQLEAIKNDLEIYKQDSIATCLDE
eukprot:gene395-499_t